MRIRDVVRVISRNRVILLVSIIWFTLTITVFLHVCRLPDATGEITRMTNTAKASEPTTFLIILILTAVGNTARRDAMRKTWLKNYIDQSVLVQFSIGTKNLPLSKLNDLIQENHVHNDILLLPDFEESYTKLTSKLSTSLQWICEHHNFWYLLKVDDDSFVVLPKMISVLQTKPLLGFYYGFFDGHAHVRHKGKWTESDWFMCDLYTPYAVGGGYVITHDLVRYIADNRAILKHYHNEDVSLGTWLSPLDITREHDPRFDTEHVSRGCNNEYIVSHKQSIDMMVHKQRNLDENGVLCRAENRTRLSYIYNWNVPPSKCCSRVDSKVP